MKLFLRCALVASTALLVRSDSKEKTEKCFLRKSSFDETDGSFLGPKKYQYRAPKKPFPSLTQCYKNNQRACCVSAHDSYISSAYAQILSPTCLREYQHLENYFCLGCYPEQGQYLVKDNSTTDESPYLLDAGGNGIFTMRICKSFAENLYHPVAQGSYNYDNCGLLDEKGKGYLPKEKFANYSQFINEIKPPYFEKIKWEVVDDTQKGHAACFGAANAINVGGMSLAFVLLAQFVL